MKKIIAAATLLLTLAACCGTQNNKPLEGTTWKLASMEGIPATAIDSEEDAFTLEFNAADTLLAGRTNCNRFFGNYTIEGNKLTLSDNMGMTRMACPDMEYEDLFVTMLNKVNAYQIKGDKLTLLDGDKSLSVFKAVEKK